MKNAYFAKFVQMAISNLQRQNGEYRSPGALVDRPSTLFQGGCRRQQTISTYHRSKSMALLRLTIRQFAASQGFNTYRLGQHIFSRLSVGQKVGGDSLEYSAAAMFYALQCKSNEKVSHGMFVSSDWVEDASFLHKILHHVVIIGIDATETMSVKEMHMSHNPGDPDKYPWVIDSLYDVVAPLKYYLTSLAEVLSSVTTESSVFMKFRPPLGTLRRHGFSFSQTSAVSTDFEEKVMTCYPAGKEIEPMLFYHLLFRGLLKIRPVSIGGAEDGDYIRGSVEKMVTDAENIRGLNLL